MNSEAYVNSEDVRKVMSSDSAEDIEKAISKATGSEKPKRALWDNKIQYLMGVTSFAVGLGNVWRFPYLCQQHGGGAFLIPYIILLFLGGLPISLIEMGIGQKLKQGPVGVWRKIHPFLGGLGICSVIICFVVGLYYNMVIAWCLFYLFNSFTTELPWSYCPEGNGTAVQECETASFTVYYWYRTVTDISTSIDDTGDMKWWLVIALVGSWILVYICIMKGIKTSGKAMYVTAIFPYVVLTVFFIRAMTLEGASLGLTHMITPKVFFSLGLAMGTLIAFSSYNPTNNDCVKDAVVTTLINLFTSIYTSVVVFSVLGFKAVSNFRICEARNMLLMNTSTPEMSQNVVNCSLQHELDEAAEGTGLAFIVFTQAILELPGASFWSVIFFLMLLMLGLGSQFGIVEGVVTNMFDAFHTKKVRKEILSATVCLVSCIVGLIFTTRSGQYWVDLLNSFAGTTGFTLIALFEIVGVIYIYGCQRFMDDLCSMTDRKISSFWSVLWKYVSPFFIGVIFVASIVMTCIKTPQYLTWNVRKGAMQLTDFPTWAVIFGYSIVVVNIFPLPFVFLWNFLKHRLWTRFSLRKTQDQSRAASLRVPPLQLSALDHTQ